MAQNWFALQAAKTEAISMIRQSSVTETVPADFENAIEATATNIMKTNTPSDGERVQA